jgi:hypothetical protein
MNDANDRNQSAARADFDSLTAEVVIADDRGGTVVIPADPEALARYLEDCRRVERSRANKKDGPKA